MSVEINGVVYEHEKPTKYRELVAEHKRKVAELKELQKEVDDLSDMLIILDRAMKNTCTPIGNYKSKL